MEYLYDRQRRVGAITAAGKHVIVVGGGDTGSDCVGTCHRQGAASVTQLELLPQPPEARDPSTPWPLWPMQLRTSHAHEEGGRRTWSVSTTRLSGDEGTVRRLHGVRLDDGAAFQLDADLVLLAMGFTGPRRDGLLDALGVRLDARGAVATDVRHRTSVDGVFAAGDVRRGASLIVWAIREGRDAARAIDAYVTSAPRTPRVARA